jgi:hypothetical protein
MKYILPMTLSPSHFSSKKLIPNHDFQTECRLGYSTIS